MALAAPPPAADQQLLEDALGRALDAGKTGPELLSALHAAAPHFEMAAMHSLLEDYKAKEDAKLFDLVAENYRDFFRLAQSLDTSAEVRPLSLRLPHRRRSSTRLLFVRRRRPSRGRRCWRSTAR